MANLDNVSRADLLKLLDDLDESVPTQRVLAAIASKQGDSTAQIAERHGVSQQTIRNWLGRFENRPLEEAPFDEQREGRPRKLTDDEHRQLMRVLQESPQVVGFDSQVWEPRLVYRYLKSEYGVEYSLRHIRRLMDEACGTQQLSIS